MRKNKLNPTGSILIWTVLLGISLMTVFFYFSQRLSLNSATQQKSIELQNARQFLESYADYLESLPSTELVQGQIEYEGIKGFITNVIPEASGRLDGQQSTSYEIKFGKAKVEWARCAGDEAGRLLEVTPNEGLILGNCLSLEYDGVAEVSDAVFTLKAGEAPVSYRITPIGNAILYDRQWTLDLQIKTSSKKTVDLHRVFVPSE